jgi:hypothetical protein
MLFIIVLFGCFINTPILLCSSKMKKMSDLLMEFSFTNSYIMILNNNMVAVFQLVEVYYFDTNKYFRSLHSLYNYDVHDMHSQHLLQAHMIGTCTCTVRRLEKVTIFFDLRL